MPVEVGSNGAYAIAIVTKQTGGTTIPSLYYEGDVTGAGPGLPYGILAHHFRGTADLGTYYSGTFVFDSYIVVGSASSVLSDLAYLHTIGVF